MTTRSVGTFAGWRRTFGGAALGLGLLLAAGFGPGARAASNPAPQGPRPSSATVTSVPSAPMLESAEKLGPGAAFDAAARLYEQGRPGDAAAAYQRLIQEGTVTPAVLFNFGNASLQAGRVGQAIAAYRQALRLAPRDPEIEANLARARGRVGNGAGTVEGFVVRFLRLLSPNEWAMIALGGIWLWFGLLLAREVRPKWKGKSGALVWTFATLGVLAGTAAVATGRREAQRAAVVIAADSAVRYGPLEESQSPFTLPDGAEVVVTDQKGDWLEVRDAAGRRGWIMGRNVAVIP